MNKTGATATDPAVTDAKLANFLSDGMQVLAVAKQAQAKLDRQAATGFSVFDYLRSNENNLSRVFECLLDPKGAHGQGFIFLQLFLQEINLPKYPSADEGWKVHREYTTNENRRIDIVLNHRSGRWIGIENKPWAGEQYNQVQHYLKYLQCYKDENAWICYLSGYGREPTTIKNKDKEKCRTVTYRQGKKPSIENWISQCIKACEADSVRWFLKDLLKYIRYVFWQDGAPSVDYKKGDVVTEKIAYFIIEKAKSNLDNLDSALWVANAMPVVREWAILEFTQQIERHLDGWLQKHGREKEWTVRSTTKDKKEHMKKNDAWVVLYKKCWKFDNPKEDGDGWPAAGAALNAVGECWGHVRLCVAARKEYDPKLGIKFEEELRNSNALKHLGNHIDNSGYKPSPVYWEMQEKELENWNSDEFVKAFFNERWANEKSEELADKLCKLAETLDGMNDFQPLIFGETK